MATEFEEHPQEKKSFFKTFGLVVAVLHGVALMLMAIAWSISKSDEDPEMDRERLRQVEQRVGPVAQVITSDEQLKKVTAAAAQTGPDLSALDGTQVVAQVCGACHSAGVLGAPKSHDPAQWSARQQAAGGLDGLVASAVRGKGQMPPKGGALALSDAQIRQAIEVMLK